MCQSRRVRYGCICAVTIEDDFNDLFDLSRFGINWNVLDGTPYKMKGTIIEFIKRKTINF